jgi:DNA polymerase III subunit epsilon
MSLPPIAGPIAVFDVETTGLFPSRHDRVIEVALVVIGANGEIEREFVSLVNPVRDIGPSSIHGLTSEDILPAPQFREIASLLLDALHGTVAIAGHNVRFDRQFLEAEFIRMGEVFPDCLSLCSMELGWGGNLAKCCHDFGIHIEGEAHHALADARAAARLLLSLLPDLPRSVRLNDLQPIHWPTVSRSSKQPVTRADSRCRQAEPPTFLQQLLRRVQDQSLPPVSDGAVMAYGNLLERVLEDRCIDASEADALLETAAQWGLGGEQVELAHRDYLDRLATAAVEDSVVTDAERRDLRLVARLLGQEKASIDELLKETAAKGAQVSKPSPSQVTGESLVGKRVCFTGELQYRRNGELISRELAEELSTRAGLIVVDSVTKKLDVLVVADPYTQSGKAKKARQYGIRVMHEPVFWKSIGANVH